MAETMTFTLRETAFVFGDKLKNIVRLIDEHAELGVKVTHGNRSLRVLGMPDLIYLQALNEVGDLLTPRGRLELHKALLHGRAKREIFVGKFSLPIDQLQNDVEKRLDALKRLKDTVEGNPEDPFIKGTRIEVYRISALVDGGATCETVLTDYPSLTDEQIELACAYAAAIPKKGRPYPKISFKRAIGALGLDALDDAPADGARAIPKSLNPA